jgi:hypothetical protein
VHDLSKRLLANLDAESAEIDAQRKSLEAAKQRAFSEAA